MRLSPLAFALLPLSLLASCATVQPKPARVSATLGQYHFAYRLANRRAVELIQAFDNGSTTYLQFRELTDAPIVVATGTNTPLPYRRHGDYLVVPGVHRQLSVMVAGQIATVTNKDAPPAPARPAGLAPAPVAVARIVATATPALAAIPSKHPAPAADPPPRTRVFTIPFPGEGVIFTDAAYGRLAAAVAALSPNEPIILYGRAQRGPHVTLAMAQHIALHRAWVVEAYLLQHGADYTRIRVFYSGKRDKNLVRVDMTPKA